MTDYDARQFNLMIASLDYFDQEAIGLGHLVSNLEGLLSALEEVDVRWENAFRSQWGVLEDVYADALYRKLDRIPDDHTTLVAKSAQEIRHPISERMSSKND